MGLSKRAKIGIGIIGAVLISSWGVYTYVQKQKELKRELTIEETRDLRPFSAVDKTYSNEEGQLVMTFKFEKEYIDENKRQKMEYYLYNSQNDELTKMPLDSEDKVEYTIDLKEVIRPEIMKFVNTGDGQYPYDPYRFQELLRNEFVDEHLYWIAVPKNYMKKHDIDNYDKFAKENSFFTTSSDIAFELDLTEQNKDSFRGGYSTISEYVSSLITNDLSPQDFAYLVTKVRGNVPRKVEILNATPFEGQYSAILKKGYFARGNYDFRRTGYVVPEDFGLPTYSPMSLYMRTYSVSESEEEALAVDISEWNQQIIDDKETYEKDSDMIFFDKKIQKVGKIENALFTFRINDELGQWLEITTDDADE
ncbi:TPA: hypothetical protein LIY66_001262 [Enterococcus faecium]|nr:hypothetical protein [Enterococcus faecium]